jgi:membrane-associated phospholipid phosphatase
MTEPLLADLLPSRLAVIRTGAWMFAALLVAFALDIPVASSLHTSGWDQRYDTFGWKWVVKAPGEWWLALILAGLLAAFHPGKLRAAGFLAACAALSGLHVILKWSVGRHRPYTLEQFPDQLRAFHFAWFRDGLPGFFAQKNLSFPSGHTCTAFAVAAALAILLPRWKWLFYAFAAATGLQRVSENAHFVSDVTMAAVCGVGVTYGFLWVCSQIEARQSRAAEREPDAKKVTS